MLTLLVQIKADRGYAQPQSNTYIVFRWLSLSGEVTEFASDDFHQVCLCFKNLES